MYSEITNYLRLCDVERDTFIFVSKDAISDINFVFSDVLQHYIKNNYSVILLNFAQSCAHYNHVLLKSGVNLRQLRENQRFINIDGMAEIEKLTNFIPCETEKNNNFSALFSEHQGSDCVKQLYLSIKTLIETSIDDSKQFVLFLDDISSLLNLGVNLSVIALLVQYCRSLCFNQGRSQNVLLIGSMHENIDPENNKMVNYFLHLADIKIQVEGLKTGYSKDAHGKIAINVKTTEEHVSIHEKFLFKVSEKGAKLLTLG